MAAQTAKNTELTETPIKIEAATFISLLDLLLRLLLNAAFLWSDLLNQENSWLIYFSSHSLLTIFSFLLLYYREWKFNKVWQSIPHFPSFSKWIIERGKFGAPYQLYISGFQQFVAFLFSLLFTVSTVFVFFKPTELLNQQSDGFLTLTIGVFFTYGTLLFLYMLLSVPGHSRAKSWKNEQMQLNDDKSLPDDGWISPIQLPLTATEKRLLEKVLISTGDRTEANRIRMLLMADEGLSVQDIAEKVEEDKNYIREWVSIFRGK